MGVSDQRSVEVRSVIRALIFLVFSLGLWAQTGAVNIISGKVDLSSAVHTAPTIVVASVDLLPTGTCTVGELAQVTSAAAGQQIYENSGSGTCVWTQQGSTPIIPPTPGYQPNQLLSGCGVEYTTGLSFTVGACIYTIAGVTYSSVLTGITLTAADPSNPRIDAIIVDNTSTVSFLTGTPAASPATPNIDPATQLALAFILVPTASSTPGNITSTLLYDENVGSPTEWNCTSSANLTCNSTNNPYHGSKDIEATAAVKGNSFTLTIGSGSVDLANYGYLILYVRSKATWPTKASGANAARFITFTVTNGSTQQGLGIVLRDGQFGFSSSITTAYQQIYIPVSAFGANGSTVTQLIGTISGNTGTSSIGFYVDEITLQSNTTTQPPPSGTITTFQVNGTKLLSQGTVNFVNSAAFQGLTFTFTNGTAGNIKLGASGALNSINGTTIPVNSAADQTIVTTASAVGSWASIPSCIDAGGNHLNYNTTTHLFSCGNTGGTAASVAFSGITSGTNGAATMTVGTGATITVSGSGVNNANQVNAVVYPSGPSLNTVPVVTNAASGGTVTYEAVPNAALANSATTPNGQTCTLGSTCNVNVGAAAHSVALNQGNGSALTGVGPGTTGQLLRATTSGDPQYIDFPDSKSIPFGICVNGTAATGGTTTTSVGATCRAGTNNKDAYVGPFTTSDSLTFKVHLPKDWDTGTAPSLSVDMASTDATNGHTIILQAATECSKLDGTTTDDVAFNAAQSLSTVTLNTTANQTWTATLTSLTTTGCSAPGIMWVKITRTTDTATNVELYEADITIPRLLTVQAN